MKKRLSFIFTFFLVTFTLFADEGVLFQFKHNKGDAVSHISTVQEEVFLNGRLNNTTEFINRTSTTVLNVEKDGSALLHTKYMTTQNSLLRHSGNYLSWGEEDEVHIHRTKTGKLYDSDNPFLPTVRNIPSFPTKKVQIGESWTSDGMEVHDCRQLFNMTEALTIPFTATYTYMGKVDFNNTELHVIDVSYAFYQEKNRKMTNDDFIGKTYNEKFPKKRDLSTYSYAKGYAKQRIFWDTTKNDIDHFDEQFHIQMVDIYGNSYVYNGISQGEVTEYKSVNDEKNVKQLQQTINENHLENVQVNRGEKGLTISIENIQFEPDSPVLLPSEKQKLQKLGSILKDFSNDLLITGHCAERGSVSSQMSLSLERAKAVADFLVQNNIRDELHIFTQGKGATEPIASNSTEAGRQKNRRVEITIMD